MIYIMFKKCVESSNKLICLKQINMFKKYFIKEGKKLAKEIKISNNVSKKIVDKNNNNSIFFKGIVIKKIADKFWISQLETKAITVCSAKGILKQQGVYVGDIVVFNINEKNIVDVLPRHNLLIRPPMANLNQLFIVLAYEPKPDYLMLDKLIIFCLINDIKPIICLNKIDKSNIEQNYINEVYSSFFDVLYISAQNKINLDELKKYMTNQVSAFAGQSGVGKSALINAIFNESKAIEGELSAKILRGKNTTRHIQLYEIFNNSFIADTPGFSALDEKLLPIQANKLPYYYPDFLKYLNNCKYKSCLHFNEKDCGIKTAVNCGYIDKKRYLRYLTILESLKTKQNY